MQYILNFSSNWKMKVTRHLSDAVLFFLVLHGCYCEDMSNDVPMNIPNDDDDMRVRDGSGDGEYRETEEEGRNSSDDYSHYGYMEDSEFILNEYGMSVEHGIENGNEDESELGEEKNETEGKDLLPISLLAISVGISLVVIVSIVIVMASLIYFLQKKRSSHNIKHIKQKERRRNEHDRNTCGFSLNFDYEPTERDRSKPMILEMSYYETPMATNSSHFEYDYPINTVRARCTKAEDYLNV
ncbi:hypothetical protein HOLleu_23979 [Holothuria leucospilota]|uniref:Uncharacterized protein n=1 Tax=Holothuria leucospilota TaxID=206669 RepID=A0A9Q1H607_HOLLE|nr:hypothetical protein HOLleu_23979 [Holothuria leucospilota]